MSETIDVKAKRTDRYARRKATGNQRRVVVRTHDRDAKALRQRVETEVENREFRLALAAL